MGVSLVVLPDTGDPGTSNIRLREIKNFLTTGSALFSCGFKFKVDGKEITKDINLGTTYKSPREAAAALEKFLRSKGIKYFEYDLERVKPKDDDYMDKTPYSKTNTVGEAISLDKLRSAGSPETQSNKDLADRLKQSIPSKTRNPVAKNANAGFGGGGAGAHSDKSKTIPRKEKHKGKQFEQGVAEETVNELSNQLLGRYKKAAGADASAADKAGDFEKGDKRFKGIVKATIKQGDNDSKKHKEQGKS